MGRNADHEHDIFYNRNLEGSLYMLACRQSGNFDNFSDLTDSCINILRGGEKKKQSSGTVILTYQTFKSKESQRERERERKKMMLI